MAWFPDPSCVTKVCAKQSLGGYHRFSTTFATPFPSPKGHPTYTVATVYMIKEGNVNGSCWFLFWIPSIHGNSQNTTADRINCLGHKLRSNQSWHNKNVSRLHSFISSISADVHIKNPFRNLGTQISSRFFPPPAKSCPLWNWSPGLRNSTYSSFLREGWTNDLIQCSTPDDGRQM